MPASSMAMAEGLRKLAVAVARPSLEPEPTPAKMAASPAGVTERMTLFAKSATRSTPVPASTASPCGSLNLALVPIPLAKPCVWVVEPARILHVGAAAVMLMRRMFWFNASAM